MRFQQCTKASKDFTEESKEFKELAGRLQSLCEAVLAKLPKDVMSAIDRVCDEVFFAATSEAKGKRFSYARFDPARRQLWVQSYFACKLSTRTRRGLFAHELAHAYAYASAPNPILPGPEAEREADRLACEWGFADEIAQLNSEDPQW